MKLLLVLDDAHRAQTLVDYLLEQGLSCTLTADKPQRICVWLADETQWPQAQEEVQRFLADPSHPRYLEAAWRRGDAPIKFTHEQRSENPLLANLWRRTGPVNLVVLVACVLIYIGSVFGFTMFQWLAFPPHLSLLAGPEFWRVFTPALLHFSVMHLVFNLFWWWYLAGMIEQQRGSMHLILLLLVAAALPNTLQFLTNGPFFGGLSGVVYALLAYVWLSGRINPAGGMSLPDGMAVMMLLWLVLGFAGMLGAVANFAHLGGGLIGLLQAVLDRKRNVHQQH